MVVTSLPSAPPRCFAGAWSVGVRDQTRDPASCRVEATLDAATVPRTRGSLILDSSELMKVTLGAAMGELEGLSSRSTVAMLLADDARRYVDVNEAACALLGRDRK